MGLENEDVLEAIRKALEGLQFGSVEITVHESKVVQIERKERVRLNNEVRRVQQRDHK